MNNFIDRGGFCLSSERREYSFFCKISAISGPCRVALVKRIRIRVKSVIER